MTTTPIEARHALKTLTDAIASIETQLADMTVRERELTAQNRGLLIRSSDHEQKLTVAQRCCNEKSERVQELEPQVRDLTRRLGEETTRANNAETVSNEKTAKADSYDRLAGLALKLVDAFERLPLKTEDGHPIPTDVLSDIPLYGTYEWKAVADAKIALEQALNE